MLGDIGWWIARVLVYGWLGLFGIVLLAMLVVMPWQPRKAPAPVRPRKRYRRRY